MPDKVIDFDSRKHAHVFKRKEAKVDALRQAFRLARGEADKSVAPSKSKKSKKSRKK